jgi:hypothetical protein
VPVGSIIGEEILDYLIVNNDDPRCQFFFFFFFFFCRARWLMPPDVPQPVRLIVLTLL